MILHLQVRSAKLPLKQIRINVFYIRDLIVKRVVVLEHLNLCRSRIFLTRNQIGRLLQPRPGLFRFSVYDNLKLTGTPILVLVRLVIFDSVNS